MADRYDVIILGGGNAGFGVSAVAQEAGKKIAFVEERDFGGTCPNRGCTPKKILVAAAHALHEIETAHAHGIDVGGVNLDWAKLIQREKNMISSVPEAMEGLARRRGDVFKGSAKFVGPNAIEVNGTILEGENIVIATGARPRPLPIPGAEYLITSEEILSDECQPDTVVFIGGGVIAMEFSHVYARAGTKVTILEAMPRLLPRLETDAVAKIRAESERIGITVKTGITVKEILKANGQLRVVYEWEGQEITVDADRIVNGTGRVANLDTLELDAGNVKHDGTAVETDEYLRSTTNLSVWVCGDTLVTSAQLSPLATYEGRVVGQNIVEGPKVKPDYTVVPNCVYTVPGLSSVGLTEEEAKEKGLNIAVSVSDMTDWFSGKTHAETVAWAKVMVDEDTGQFVGAHLIGHHGEDLIHLFALAMRYKIPACSLKNDIFAFPTFSSDVKNLF